MVIYLINLFSIPIWYMLFKNILKKEKYADYVINIVCIQIILILGLRATSVGVDTKTYRDIFLMSGKLPFGRIFDFYLEPLYVLINKMIYILGLGFNGVLFVNAIISVLGIRSFILGQSKNKIMSLWLFITFGYMSSMMNIMRQFIAITFVLMAYQCIIKKDKWYKFVLFGLLAYLSHDSSILPILVLIPYKIMYVKDKTFSRLAKTIAGIATVVGLIFAEQILGLFSFLDLSYLQTGAGYQYNLFNFNFFLKILCLVACYIIEFVNKNKEDSVDKERFQLLKFLMIVSCVMNIASVKFNMFTRLNVYFSITMIALIPNIVEAFPIKEKQFVRAGVFIATGALYVIELMADGNAVVPYEIFL